MIYLDYAANHPAEPEVLARFCAVESAFPGNPNSAHPAGRAAKAELERVTASAAELLGAKPEEIIFTSGATEANNLAIKGLARASRHVGRHIISTALEHSSVSGSLTCLQEQGYEIDLVPIGRDGRVDPEEFRALLRPDTVLAAVTAVDSELGVIQPIPEMREILKNFPNCRLHVDATQAIGRIPFSFKGLDTMALAAHKFGGINGSGILVKRADLVLEPQMHGGVSATLYRSGTPALALDASTELALRMALEHLHQLGHQHGVLAAGDAHGDLVPGLDQLIVLHRIGELVPDGLAVFFQQALLDLLAGRQYAAHSVLLTCSAADGTRQTAAEIL